MVIRKNFGAATIRKPGAYSKSQVSPDAGTSTISNDTLLLVGESDAGPGGADEGIQFYAASAFNRLKAKYRGGPLVDCAKAALIPSKTPGIGGVGKIGVWKTNPSSQAELALESSYGTEKAQEYGVGGNRITQEISLSAEVLPFVEGSAAVTDFVGLDGETLIVRSNGEALETVTFSSPSNIADVISQIEAGSSDLSATESSGVLKVERDSIANHNRDGWGMSLEVIGGTALAKLFLVVGFSFSSAESKATMVASQIRDDLVESSVVGGLVVMSVGRDDSDSCTAATVEVTSSTIELVATGSDSYSLNKSEYPTISQLVSKIGSLAGWSVSSSAVYGTKAVGSLDEVSAIGAFSEAGEKPARIKMDSDEVANFFSESSIVEISSQVEKGLPDALSTTNLLGGLRGASASSSFDSGFAAALAEDINQLLPCVSQDGSEDASAGLTDPASAYDIETVHALLDTHLRLRGSIKNKKEAQGAVGYRKATKEDVFEQSANVGSELVQVCMQDVMVVDASTSELTWKQPHVFAALLLGMRLGTEVGEPMTHKYLNCSGIGHYVNSSTGVVGGDFDPQLDYDEALDAGVTYGEPASGGFRISADNTSYGRDESFVFNRGSVMEASIYAAKTIRTDAELAFVGKKNASISATTIKSRIRTKLIGLFEDKILSASDDAPQGFVEETFIVEVEGNTASVQVSIYPVQGLDFILLSFTLGDSKTSA